MSGVPTLHLRNVPTRVYERLRRRSKASGRSMNAEAVALLAEGLEREARTASVTEGLRRLAREIDLPPGASRPEEIVRQMRDAEPRGL
jgi:plasmid stability protein